MKKHKGYYYTIKTVETAPIKKYAWFIRNQKREVLESSLERDSQDFETMWTDKGECEYDCIEAISEYYR